MAERPFYSLIPKVQDILIGAVFLLSGYGLLTVGLQDPTSPRSIIFGISQVFSWISFHYKHPEFSDRTPWT